MKRWGTNWTGLQDSLQTIMRREATSVLWCILLFAFCLGFADRHISLDALFMSFLLYPFGVFSALNFVSHPVKIEFPEK